MQETEAVRFLSYGQAPCGKETTKRQPHHYLFSHPIILLAVNRRFIIRIPTLGPDGMALFPFILVRQPNPGPVLINHERIHLRQQAEMGVLPFYLWYVVEYGIRLLQYRNQYRAYRNISFEREAFANDTDLTYLRVRPFWSFWRYLFSE